MVVARFVRVQSHKALKQIQYLLIHLNQSVKNNNVIIQVVRIIT